MEKTSRQRQGRMDPKKDKEGWRQKHKDKDKDNGGTITGDNSAIAIEFAEMSRGECELDAIVCISCSLAVAIAKGQFGTGK